MQLEYQNGVRADRALLHDLLCERGQISELDRQKDSFGRNSIDEGDSLMYKPNPIDTSKIELPEELLELTEKIAKNVHENWSVGHIAEGWTYGETRDDGKKTTPCLVPYSELTDSEKEYDRVTALQTLKLIVALGYKIEKK